MIGRNLRMRGTELGYPDMANVTRAPGVEAARRSALIDASVVLQVAGMNHTPDDSEFERGPHQ